jgi:hypothetical protein
VAPRNQLQLEHQRDFGGGLNLDDDPYKLAPNESFDLQNVDIDRRGGFGLRRGTREFIEVSTQRVVTATGASRTGNVVTATGLSPVNGDPGGLKPGQVISVVFADASYNGTFTVATAVAAATTATWAQTAADDAAAGAGTITEGLGSPDSGYTYVDTSLLRHILVARGGSVKRWDGSAWQDVIALTPTQGRVQFAEFRNVLYILRPNGAVPHTWTGSGTATQLTTAVGNYNDDLTAPNQGNFPPSNTIATHKEVMWAGGVIDTGAVVHDSRLRWSHPGQAQDWRTNDFIDIDPDDENGRIRALIPFGDRLLVFKDKAIYALHGDPPAGFSVQNLTKELGTPSAHSVVATEEYVYFWDKDKGAWRYDGKQFEWIFEPIYRLIDDEKINVPFSFQVIAEFHRERLWLSVPFLTAPYANNFISLVFQPSAGNKGAWTVHTRTLFGWWVHRGSDGGDEHLIGGQTTLDGPYLYELDVENLFEDEFRHDQFTRIRAHYTTRWFDAKNSAMKKRWKRPVVVMRAGSTQRTIVDVLRDYDPTRVFKTFDLNTTLDGETGIWDVSDWDDALWAPEVTLGGEKSVALRGAPLSGGVARALRFKNTTQGQDWRIHGLTMKWIPRRIRN